MGGHIMRNFSGAVLLLAAVSAVASNAQTVSTNEQLSTDAVGMMISTAPAPLVLPLDTPVHLMVLTEVTTKEHSAGHRFKLRVQEPVILDGTTVIPVGAIAWGEVLSAERSGNVGKSGKVSARLLYVETGGVRVPLTGETNSKGKSGTAETVMGVLSLGVLGLFAKGNNAKIKAGEKMIAFTSEATELPRPSAQ